VDRPGVRGGPAARVAVGHWVGILESSFVFFYFVLLRPIKMGGFQCGVKRSSG